MKSKSFTLIELLVVIVIIGILAGVIMISTSSSIDKANIAKLKVFEESVANNLAANIVSRWKLDEGSGTTANDIWGDNNGTITGALWKNESECVSGKCLDFNGGTYRLSVNTATTLNIEKELTVTAWIYLRQHEYIANIVKKYESTSTGSWYFSTGSDTNGKKLRYTFIDEDSVYRAANSSSDLPLNQWTFVAWSYDGTPNLYINNTKETFDFIGKKLLINSNRDLEIGTVQSDRIFNGLIDDVRLYNAALPSSQIKQNYIAGLNSLLSKRSISKEDYIKRINSLSQK
ncbi:MAG: LamG-like jellyroll fold domain-containing protein [Bacilli bacterium]